VFNLNSIDRSFTTRPLRLSGQPGGHHNATGTGSAARSPNPIAGICEVPPIYVPIRFRVPIQMALLFEELSGRGAVARSFNGGRGGSH
jgi:hypothetical protein